MLSALHVTNCNLLGLPANQIINSPLADEEVNPAILNTNSCSRPPCPDDPSVNIVMENEPNSVNNGFNTKEIDDDSEASHPSIVNIVVNPGTSVVKEEDNAVTGELKTESLNASPLNEANANFISESFKADMLMVKDKIEVTTTGEENAVTNELKTESLNAAPLNEANASFISESFKADIMLMVEDKIEAATAGVKVAGQELEVAEQQLKLAEQEMKTTLDKLEQELKLTKETLDVLQKKYDEKTVNMLNELRLLKVIYPY